MPPKNWEKIKQVAVPVAGTLAVGGGALAIGSVVRKRYKTKPAEEDGFRTVQEVNSVLKSFYSARLYGPYERIEFENKVKEFFLNNKASIYDLDDEAKITMIDYFLGVEEDVVIPLFNDDSPLVRAKAIRKIEYYPSDRWSTKFVQAALSVLDRSFVESGAEDVENLLDFSVLGVYLEMVLRSSKYKSIMESNDEESEALVAQIREMAANLKQVKEKNQIYRDQVDVLLKKISCYEKVKAYFHVLGEFEAVLPGSELPYFFETPQCGEHTEAKVSLKEAERVLRVVREMANREMAKKKMTEDETVDVQMERVRVREKLNAGFIMRLRSDPGAQQAKLLHYLNDTRREADAAEAKNRLRTFLTEARNGSLSFFTLYRNPEDNSPHRQV